MLYQLVVVCGMHRTGTSTITKSLETLGINLGNNLLEAIPGVNDKGFFEDRDFLNINEELLKRFDTNWHSLVALPQKNLFTDEIKDLRKKALELTLSKIKVFPHYGIKDPRFSILLPFWQDIFNELSLNVSYILPCRDPISVASSLQKRDGFPYIKSFYLWTQYILSSLEYTANHNLIVIDYNKVLDSPISEITRLASFLKVDNNLDSKKLEEYQQSFLDRSLQHARFTNEEITSREDLPTFIKEFYELLLCLANDQLTPQEILTNPKFIKLQKENQDLFATKVLFDSFEKDLTSQTLKQNEFLLALQENQEKLTNLNVENTNLKSSIKNLSEEVLRNENEIQILAEQRTKNQNEITYLDSLLIKERELSKSLQEEVKKRDDFISFLDNLRAQKEQELLKLTTSRSWKITKPLRQITEKLRAPQKKSQFEFMFLAESGILEYQALLLAESIRKFAGKYSNSKITVISPRINKRPLKTTIDKLKSLDVRYLPLDLKSICPEYGTTYRMLASAYFEKNSNADILVVLDSDTIFMKEPDLDLFDYDIGARPVDVKGMCTTGSTEDPMDKYWRQLCLCCKVDYDSIPMTTSTVDRHLIKSSYNGGLVVAKRSTKLFSKTNDFFIKSAKAGLLPYKGTSNQVSAGHGLVTLNGSQYWGSSQACLSLAATKLKLKIKIFSPSNNFPLHISEHFNSLSEDSIKDICHIHYHHLLPTIFNQKYLDDKFLLFPKSFREWLSKRHAQLFDEIKAVVNI